MADVLEPISGYLRLAQKLLTHGQDFADAWNFGPLQHSAITTLEVVQKLVDLWDGDRSRIQYDPAAAKVHEAHSLHLNWDKSASLLEWRPVLTIDEALSRSVKWYQAYQRWEDINVVLPRCLKVMRRGVI
jgi:CDP-glucose 4,6-dehydratase